ncbi:aldo/keto reductase [Kitasatospora sp. NPDC090091]|uniref:aldo/keto reductase n=1 Tax=Kitasatospora sp. NPDC090091 TaxID=3364081 RepID=UPI0038192FBC
MEYARLGNSGLMVSRASLGTMNFGPSGGVGVGSCDEAEARLIIDAFLDTGHNLIDTADAYTGGESERIVGRAIKRRRDAVVLATKAFLPQGPGANDKGLSRAHLTRALDASLRRLGTDYIDLYQCHQWDPGTPIDETMATLDDFVRSGKVRYVGCSNFTAAQIVESQWAAERVRGTRFVSLQHQYSLLAQSIEPEIRPTCERHGLGTLIWSPLGDGVLTGRYARDATPDRSSRIGRLMDSPSPLAQAWGNELLAERNLDIADEVAKIAAALGSTSTAVALAWVRQRPGVTSVILGPRTLDQLTGNLTGFALDLPSDTIARLDEISATGARLR